MVGGAMRLGRRGGPLRGCDRPRVIAGHRPCRGCMWRFVVIDHKDIVVVGGGLNGAAAALALSRGAQGVTLIEPRPPLPPDEAWDSRIYAYSPGNVVWLRELGGWDDGALRAQPVFEMRVHGDTVGALHFDALETGLPELAWIAENGRLQWQIWQALRTRGVNVVTSPVQEIVWGCGSQPPHTLHLQDGQSWSVQLLIGADGANSFVRRQAGIGVTVEDYHQSGIVANFEVERPHRGIAWQWFRHDGVLAWLPLAGNRISMVWSTPENQVQTRMSQSAADLTAEVFAAGGGALGKMQMITAPVAFSLKRRRASEWVRPGLVLLGDAAHTVHPLAGQGVNLGFRDSRLLAQLLASGGDPGELGRLKAYAARRMEDVASMQWVTGNLKKLFNEAQPWMKPLRNGGMQITDALGLIKQALMRHAVL